VAWWVVFCWSAPVSASAGTCSTAPPAPPGPDAQQVKALEDQIDKQKTANKQVEDQIAALKDRLRADVCTAKDPVGKQSPMPKPDQKI
jgi:vacuolar-type H+-ATPase subunit I/STV1